MCVGGEGGAAVFNNLDAAGLYKGEKMTCKGDCFFQCHLSRLGAYSVVHRVSCYNKNIRVNILMASLKS